MDIFEIRQMCKKLGVSNIIEHIDFITKHQFYTINKKSILRMFDYSDTKQSQKIFEMVDFVDFDSLYMGISFLEDFPKDIMILKSKALIEGKSAELICIGEIQKDFEYFFSL